MKPKELSPSKRLLEMLKKREALVLRRYQLGDGGWTIGYGHYTPYGQEPPPETISKERAEELLLDDVVDRAAKWVWQYVTAELEQWEFDALVHMAFNLSPKAFRSIAEAVNRGEGPDRAALQFIRAGTNLENGLRKRRAEEFALYHEGKYTT